MTTLAGDPLSVTPDYAAPIEAWRVWRVDVRGDEVVLESLFAAATWEPGVPLRASCALRHRMRWRPWRYQVNDHPAPQLDCTCGIYGVQTEAVAREYLDERRFALRSDRVLGRVALWGEVVECEGGWRASRAYPLELRLPVAAPEVDGLRRRAYLDETALGLEAYGVPVDLVPAHTSTGVLR